MDLHGYVHSNSSYIVKFHKFPKIKPLWLADNITWSLKIFGERKNNYNVALPPHKNENNKII